MKKLTLTISAVALALAGTAYAAQEGGMRMKDPMGDKTVTRAEAEAKAKEHFAMMDVNSDGKLDKADHAARQLEHFKKMDTDRNGSISQAEFLAAHQRGPGNEHSGMGGPDGKMAMPHERGAHEGGPRGAGGKHGKRGMDGGHKMMMLHMADANKDGVITRDEMVGGMLKHFDMTDTNKDGKVTPEERRAAMAKMHEHMKSMKGGMKHGMNPPPPPAN